MSAKWIEAGTDDKGMPWGESDPYKISNLDQQISDNNNKEIQQQVDAKYGNVDAAFSAGVNQENFLTLVNEYFLDDEDLVENFIWCHEKWDRYPDFLTRVRETLGPLAESLVRDMARVQRFWNEHPLHKANVDRSWARMENNTQDVFSWSPLCRAGVQVEIMRDGAPVRILLGDVEDPDVYGIRDRERVLRYRVLLAPEDMA